MRKGRLLKDGSVLYTIAPSFGVTFDPYLTRYKKSVENMKNLGYFFIEGKNVFLNDGFFSSNDPKKRAEELMEAFTQQKSDFIFTVGGGEMAIEILPFIDFEKIKKCIPKWVIGFSDITNVIFPLTTITDLMTIYGPCMTSYFNSPLILSSKNTISMLKGEKHFEGYPFYCDKQEEELDPLAPLLLNQKKELIVENFTSPFKGILLGGCLDCLHSLVGTRFDKVKDFTERHRDEKIIFFLENCELSNLEQRRALFQLKEASWFDNCAGFLIGRDNRYTYEENPYFFETYQAIRELNLPIIYNCDFGHIPPSLPMMMGATCTVSIKDNNLIMDYQ